MCGAVRHIHAEAGLDRKSAGSKLPAQLDRHDVGVMHAALLDIEGRAQASHHKRLHEDGIVGCTEEGPAGDEQKALRVLGGLKSDLVVVTKIGKPGADKIALIGEYLVEHINARRRNAGTRTDQLTGLALRVHKRLDGGWRRPGKRAYTPWGT